MRNLTDQLVQSRSRAYDQHYQTQWQARPFTRADLENCLAYAPDVERGGHLNGNEIQLALKRIGAPNLQGKTVLDYCCGAGITAIYFALCGAKVWAFDASHAALVLARENARLSGPELPVSFAQADGRQLPFPDNMFDIAFCQSALHIVVDYPECPMELARVLKPGAKAVFCEEGLGYNPLLRPIHYLRRQKYRACGGHPLTYDQIYRFGRPFARTTLFHFNLLLQAKAMFWGHLEKHGRLLPWVRRTLRILETLDRKILSAAPWMQRLCAAVAVEYVK
jgi:SAM-dependent methyltransferase